jgi:hypothetical protein
MPKALARPSGGVTSAMYANAVLMVAAVMPEMMRPMNSSVSDGASAMKT